MIDPTCLMHGQPKSTHFCVQCCLCFKDLKTEEECHMDADGQRWDICDECARQEAAYAKAPTRTTPAPGGGHA